MVRPKPRPARVASALAAATLALGLAAPPRNAAGQNVFNPYMPYNSQYYSAIVPTIPNNLAMPGAAREAREYEAEARGSGISRYNSFDRWAAEYDREVSGGVGGGRGGDARGLSYDPRRPDLSRDPNRAYVPNREADRKFQIAEDRRTRDFYDKEEERERIATQRDIYFQAASRTTNPQMRDAYLRVVSKLSNPSTARATLREIDDAIRERQTAAQARTDAKTGTGTGTSSRANGSANTTGPRPPASLAAPVEPTVTPTPGTGAVTKPGTTAAAPDATRSRSTETPDRRPPLDSELRAPASPSDRPSPPTGLGPLVAPDPIPDEPPGPVPPPR